MYASIWTATVCTTVGNTLTVVYYTACTYTEL